MSSGNIPSATVQLNMVKIVCFILCGFYHKKTTKKNTSSGNSLVQWLGLSAFIPRTWAQSLGGTKIPQAVKHCQKDKNNNLKISYFFLMLSNDL